MKLQDLLWAGIWGMALSSPLPALAQTAAKPAANAGVKAAAKPVSAASAADSKLISLGNGKGSGPVLTREELRACLTQDEQVHARTAELEARRAPLDKEKQALAADQATLLGERSSIDEFKRRADALSLRVKEYGVRVEALNKRVSDFNSVNRTGTQGDREREALNKERDDLQLLQKDIEAEKARFATESEAGVRAYNAKAQALEGRVTDWNQRNDQFNQTAKDAEAERQAWLSGCADRRYREDDETAIRRGK